MRKFIDRLYKVQEYFSVICFTLMTISILISVIFRYILKSSIPWGEELARYLMIYGVFIGISLATRAKAHLGIDTIINLVHGKSKANYQLFLNIIMVIVYISLTIFGINLVMLIHKSGQITPALRIPMTIPYFAVPLGFLLSTISAIDLAIESYNDSISESDIVKEEK